MERTFLMIKPDGVQRGLIGEIVARFERKGLQLVAAKFMKVDAALAECHYEEHKGKPFYPPLIDFITSSPVFAMVWQGDNVIALTRALIGKTNAVEAAPGTIRSDYAVHTNFNLIHGSDSPENAAREIGIFFRPEELVDYEQMTQRWI
ncbi:nucleoside diphosphate kinase [Paenibacillus darwinianus]|uniref:Nucleoside diphosphate kinase n=1 Tax=Paenibacillus darwinianus TaxID=1380763 RepID=A0A9W5S3M1_9BACL|nr:nucleoside-diphosphate kinase [Paenibacillus darwinianus]EXX91322.1 nucleoside diphosphate kinase [Paenibacillus darwinianus]EXX92164.1 nucleoside diphosphate kinase [Paenibacillus darwinianus]EXX92494.1 nucleoside diphosphate kinase [Paenibacillus darwinianus]